jgi:hypothetical protein
MGQLLLQRRADRRSAGRGAATTPGASPDGRPRGGGHLVKEVHELLHLPREVPGRYGRPRDGRNDCVNRARLAFLRGAVVAGSPAKNRAAGESEMLAEPCRSFFMQLGRWIDI